MTKEIQLAERVELLMLSKLFAGLVFTEEAEREWLKGRFAMYDDILRQSQVFQDILQEGIEQGREQVRQEWPQRLRETLLKIVQKRFPQLVETVKQQAEQIGDLDVLYKAIVTAGTKQTAKTFADELQELKE